MSLELPKELLYTIFDYFREEKFTDLCILFELPINLNYYSNKSPKWSNKNGTCILKSIEIKLGGVVIDKHYGDWLSIWETLTEKPAKLVK